jgi:GGDEF domain-containing protein
MHYRVLVLAAWLSFFYNLERVSKFVSTERIDLLTPYSYMFVASIVLITLAFPSLQYLPLPLLAAMGVGSFLVLKGALGYKLFGSSLPITISEACGLLVTGMLTRWVILAIREFESSVVNFTIKHVGRQTRAFDIEQGEMYQEVRRARAFNRPLTLLAIAPEKNSFQAAVEKMVAEVQQATMKQYVLAALAKKLENQFGPYGVIAQDSDKFLVLLPEQSKEDIPRLVSQIRGQIQESLQLDLRIGSASLPDVELFDQLVAVAYAEMKREPRHGIPEEIGKHTMTTVAEQVTSR